MTNYLITGADQSLTAVRVRPDNLTAAQNSPYPFMPMGIDSDTEYAPTGTGREMSLRTSTGTPHHNIGASQGRKKSSTASFGGFPVKTTVYQTTVLYYDYSAETFTDESRDAIDGTTGNFSLTAMPTDDVLYVGSNVPFSQMHLNVKTVNDTGTSAMVVNYYKDDSTWTEIEAVGDDFVDGTSTGSVTLANDGGVTWTALTDWKKKWVGGQYKYWVQITFDKVLKAGTALNECYPINNPSTVIFYDDSGTSYTDDSADAMSATANDVPTAAIEAADYFYVGSDNPFNSIKAIVGSTVNATASLLEAEYYTSASTWATLTISDGTETGGTTTFAQNGDITFTEPSNWAVTDVNSTSRYWVRLSVGTTLATASASLTQLYVTTPYFDQIFSYVAAAEGTPAIAGSVTHSQKVDSFDIAMVLNNDLNPPSLRYNSGLKFGGHNGTHNGSDDLKIEGDGTANRGGMGTYFVYHNDNGTYSDVTAASFNPTSTAVTAFDQANDEMLLFCDLPFNTVDFVATGDLGAPDLEYYNGSTWADVVDIMTPAGLTGTERCVYQIPSDWGRQTIRSITSGSTDDAYTQYYALKIKAPSGDGNITDLKQVLGPEDMAEIQVYDSDNSGRFSTVDQTVTIVDGEGNTLDDHWVVEELTWNIADNLSDDTYGYSAAGVANEGTPQRVIPAMREVSGNITFLYDGDDSLFDVFKVGINRQSGYGYWQQMKLVANKGSAKFDEYYEIKLNNVRFMEANPGGATTEAGKKSISFDWAAWNDTAAGLDSDSVSMAREVVMEVGQ